MRGAFWLASFPKSGNTWLRLALRSLELGGAPIRLDEDKDDWWDRHDGSRIGGIVSSRRFFEEVLNVESTDLTAEEIEALRPLAVAALAKSRNDAIFKTHDSFVTEQREPLFPLEVTKGAVVVVRDPRDVAVSLADHIGLPIDAVIDKMADPNATLLGRKNGLPSQFIQRLSTWSRHVAGWLEAPVPKLLVRYEDMKVDMPGVLAKVAAFVAMEATPDAVAGAVAATEFATLRRQEKCTGFRECSEFSAFFFRRGIAGGWRDTLTAAQARRIEFDHGVMMQRLGYEVSTFTDSVKAALG
jgi:hypothetical protein